MSRQYFMTVNVEEANPDRIAEICDAAEDESGIAEPFGETPNGAFGAGMVSLNGGETEEEYITAVAKAVWIANRGFCKVNVSCCYMEDAPIIEVGIAQYRAVEDEVTERIAEHIKEESD